MTAHACRIDYSRETGTLVACTCGFVLGPFRDRANAVEAARAHRPVHVEPVEKTPEERARQADWQRQKRTAKRRLKDPPK